MFGFTKNIKNEEENAVKQYLNNTVFEICTIWLAFYTPVTHPLILFLCVMELEVTKASSNVLGISED